MNFFSKDPQFLMGSNLLRATDLLQKKAIAFRVTSIIREVGHLRGEQTKRIKESIDYGTHVGPVQSQGICMRGHQTKL